jgi:hypothetical protein
MFGDDYASKYDRVSLQKMVGDELGAADSYLG